MKSLLFIRWLCTYCCGLVLFFYSGKAQCYGPTLTGNYTNGKKPSANSSYFINHVFSTFSSTSAGSLNGNNFSIAVSGGPATNNTTNTLTPAETVVTGTSFPSPTNPTMHRVSPNSTSIKVTYTFSSDLPAGTHVYLQDVDRQEGWYVAFKNSSGTVLNPTGFTPFNLSTTNLAALTTSSANFLFKSGSSTDRSEPLIGVILTSSSVRIIEFTVQTVSSSSSNTEFFFSVPLTPSFTATANNNGPICAGSTLTLTGGTSALASTVPTPVTYNWSGPNGYSNSSASTTASISSTTTAAGGTYTLQVQDAFGCFTSTSVYTPAVVNSKPSVSIASNTPVNYSGTITFSSTVTGGTSPYTANWSGPNTYSSSSLNPSIASVSSANAGVYTLSIVDNNGCSSSTTSYVAVKSGWIYLHEKNINEESSSDFNFKLKDTAGNTLKSFYLNDSAGNVLNVYDIGAGHDDGGGTLWAIAGATAGTSNTGTIYYRAAGSGNWIATSVTTAAAIDGAGLDKCFYVNSSGNVYYYNAGTSTLIFNKSTSHNGQTASATDVAYGGGKIAVRNSNGRVYLYTGDYTNDSWTDVSSNSNMADRIDISSDGTILVYILSATVKSYNISTASITAYPAFTSTSGAGASSTIDIAIDDNGTIYATGTTGNTTCCGNTEIIYSYAITASAWTDEPEARGVKRITGGVAGQAWGSVNLGSTFPQTIYTRVTDSRSIHVWLDDERVKNSGTLYSNSIMMEVDAGSYKLSTTIPTSTWDVGRYNIYDPTGNTTGNTTNNTATITVGYGETVHLEMIIEKLNSKVIDNGNCSTNILQSFDGGSSTGQFGSGTFGTPLEGTAYHYFSQTSPQDGFYYIVKTTDGNWFTSPGITDHTGNSGYFLLVNASYAKDEFYRQRITGLTGSLTYRIQFYAVNVLAANPIKPKIRFGMQTLSGTIFGDSTTEEITSTTWKLYSVSFTVPSGVTTADLFIRNENIGGLGNDLAIDDISINPIPTPLETNTISPVSNLCVGSTYTITNSVGGGSWATSDPSLVTVDASGNISVLKAGSAEITYTYINNAYCQSTATSVVTITAPPSVSVSVTSSDVCNNNTTILTANATQGTAPYSYAWSGSDGSLSSTTVANPTLTAPSYSGSYNYSVIVSDNAGCSAQAITTTVNVHDPNPSFYLICKDTVSMPYAQLVEINGLPGYSWFWSSSSPSTLFYPNSSFTNGTPTTTIQNPYINSAAQYKVVLTDTYGCKDSASVFYSYPLCSVLSVTVMNFTVAKNGATAVLNWKTSSEQNNRYFEIERSTDRVNWTALGHVNAAVTNTTIHNYTFTDIMPLAGMNYYRLKQVDISNNISYTAIRNLLFETNWKIKILPNPVTSGLLHITSNIGVCNLKITDLSGKVILNQNAFFSNTVLNQNVTNLPRGFYFIEIINNRKEIYHSGFIKN